MSKDMVMCTIIAKNYLAHARTLCDSFLSFHPDLKVYVLIVDEFEGLINPQAERFEIVTLTDLAIPDLASFCFKYNVTELCTASKAFLMEYLLRAKNISKVLYIDPDILITNALNDLYAKLDNFDIVLTPHIETDYPDDGLLPDDASVLSTGLFNLGFIGVNSSENARRFLAWWQGKLYNKCFIDHFSGIFVDQKYIDLASVLFNNIFIEKNVGYNVAIWNLHSRQISNANGGWKCNEGPLYFFHFSGYQQGDPQTLSTHVTSNRALKQKIRYTFSNRPDLHHIFSIYDKRVTENGYEQSRKWPYSYAFFKNGQTIPFEVRVLYRNADMQQYRNPFESSELMQIAHQFDVLNKLKSASPYKHIPGLRYGYKRLVGLLEHRQKVGQEYRK